MYKLGFTNNNCFGTGCVQGGIGYWQKVEEAHLFFFGDVGYIEKHRGADDAFFEAEIVYELYKRGVFKID